MVTAYKNKKMNNLDKTYTDLLQDILDNGVEKKDRTGTGTLSVFGRQIRHNMSEGFPLLTTKKMAWKTMVTELLWFLRGDTNIKYLVDNDCHIWDGDAYKNYEKWWKSYSPGGAPIPLSREMFIDRIKTDDEFAEKWGELGPIYGKQWRSWGQFEEYKNAFKVDILEENKAESSFSMGTSGMVYEIDQIAKLIYDLKTNPDSRRLMVSAWNVGEIDSMVLPPCHYGFQVYTRELSLDERSDLLYKKIGGEHKRENCFSDEEFERETLQDCKAFNIPTRAISLMWNQRSVDTFLGLPFNIASYGLLLEIIAKTVNMVPDELIGNLGDVHLYNNHIEQAKEQIGREITEEEIIEHLQQSGMDALKKEPRMEYISKLPKRTRQPYQLPTLNINTEFWPTESGECGIGAIDAQAVFHPDNVHFYKSLLEEDLQLGNYQSHPSIKAPLSN
jgi:thymidylate synthase